MSFPNYRIITERDAKNVLCRLIEDLTRHSPITIHDNGKASLEFQYRDFDVTTASLEDLAPVIEDMARVLDNELIILGEEYGRLKERRHYDTDASSGMMQLSTGMEKRRVKKFNLVHATEILGIDADIDRTNIQGTLGEYDREYGVICSGPFKDEQEQPILAA